MSQDIEQALRLLSQSQASEFRLQIDDLRIQGRKDADSASATSSAPAQTSTSSADASEPPKLVEFRADRVGFFFRGPNAEAPPFVEIDDEVCQGQVVGVIQQLGTFHQIKASADGVVGSIFVENGQAVEFGQPLISLR